MSGDGRGDRGLPLPFVLATGNPDKAREICEVLTDALGHPLAAWALTVAERTIGYLVVAPSELADAVRSVPTLDAAPDVEETGATLEENARIKARALADACALPAVADDTGLEVDALGGAPGVRSARYAGERASDAHNVAKLLAELDGVPDTARGARFATVAILRTPGGEEVVARGEVDGAITHERRGRGGFGYDPVFRPREGDGRTFAEMHADEKHALSHRGRAFRALAAAIRRTRS